MKSKKEVLEIMDKMIEESDDNTIHTLCQTALLRAIAEGIRFQVERGVVQMNRSDKKYELDRWTFGDLFFMKCRIEREMGRRGTIDIN